MSGEPILGSSNAMKIIPAKSANEDAKATETDTILEGTSSSGPIQMKQRLGLWNGVGIIVGIIIGE